MLNIKDNAKSILSSISFNQLNAANGKLALKIIGTAGFGYILYRTLDIYLKRRAYSHIPGPKTKGYFFKIDFNIFCYIF